MKRKTLATLVIALLAFSLMPAGVAMAAATGTANLTQGTDVLPGINDYTIAVKNTASTLPGALGGTAVNNIRIVMPPNVRTPVCPDSLGSWKCLARTAGAHTLTFYDGSLAPGATLNIPFKASTNRPFNKDQSSDFGVSLSDDGGQTGSNAPGALTSLVRVLEVLQGGMKASSPAGAADGSGTAGQSITYVVPVKNHSQSDLSVSPSLSSNGADTISNPGSAPVLAGATQDFSFPITLRTSNNDVTGAFTGGASAPESVAKAQTSTYAIQAPPSLIPKLSGFSPRVVKIGDPAITYNFKAAQTEKRGTPGITALTGTLKFADTSTTLAAPTTAPAGATNVDLAYDPTTIAGEDGTYGVTFTFEITDDNGFQRTDTKSLADALTIDNLAPVVSNVKVALPGSQTLAKDADTLKVSFDIDEAAAKIDSVQLKVTGGKTIDVPASGITRTSTGGSATVKAADHGGFGTNDGEFQAVVQASDAAPNSGGGVSDFIKIDNLLPSFNSAEVEKRDVKLQTDSEPKERTVIKVLFSDKNLVQGGCGVEQWKVDEAVVLAVYNNDGTPCDNSNSKDNYRLLVTNNEGSQTWEPNVTYTPQATAVSRPARDGAAQAAAGAVVKALNGFIPGVPTITAFTRNGGTEPMVFDADRYWTRFAGNDAVMGVAGASPGYSVQVLDGNRNGLVTAEADGTEDTVVIPLPADAADGDHVRIVRFISHTGREGKELTLTLALDRVVPEMTGATKTSEDMVAAHFSEKMWKGADFKANWLVYENNPNPAPGDDTRFYYDVDRVSGARSAERNLESAQLAQANNGPFGGAIYRLETTMSGNTRYEDRAGNQASDKL